MLLLIWALSFVSSSVSVFAWQADNLAEESSFSLLCHSLTSSVFVPWVSEGVAKALRGSLVSAALVVKSVIAKVHSCY